MASSTMSHAVAGTALVVSLAGMAVGLFAWNAASQLVSRADDLHRRTVALDDRIHASDTVIQSAAQELVARAIQYHDDAERLAGPAFEGSIESIDRELDLLRERLSHAADGPAPPASVELARLDAAVRRLDRDFDRFRTILATRNQDIERLVAHVEDVLTRHRSGS